MVYISPLEVYIDLSVEPQKDRYQMGDQISGVDASVYYSNGSVINGARLSGILSGREEVPLEFSEAGNGNIMRI